MHQTARVIYYLHPMKKNLPLLVLFIALAVFGVGCSKAQGVSKLSVDEFETKLSSTEQAQLVDVRTPEEFNGGHLKNAQNININSDEFETSVNKLDKNKPVFVYCLAGGRSASAAKYLSKQGFKTVYDMQGGITKWNAANKPLEGAENAPKGMSMNDYITQIQTDKLVLVDFNAKWCSPCKVMAPMLDSLANEQQSTVKLLKIDADANKELLKTLNVTELPTFYLVKKGTNVWTTIGLTTKQQFLDAIHKNK